MAIKEMSRQSRSLGSFRGVRFAGPVFRFSRNPVHGLCFGREVPDVGVGAIPGLYRHKPAALLDHFGLELRERLQHVPNMQSGKPTIQPCPPAVHRMLLRLQK
jgi:hypothetical protein